MFSRKQLVNGSLVMVAMLLWMAVAPTVPIFDQIGRMAQRRIDGAGKRGPTPIPPRRPPGKTGAKRPAK